MKKSLKEKKTNLEDIFSRPKSTNQEAWDLIHDFYHLVFTYMDKMNLSEADLARKLFVSRSAVSQMFNKTPNISIKKMVEIASAIGIKIKFNLEYGTLEAVEKNATVVKVYSEQQNWNYPCDTVTVFSTKKVEEDKEDPLPGFEYFGINVEYRPYVTK